MAQHQDRPKTHSVGVSAATEQDEESPVPHVKASSQVESIGLLVGGRNTAQVFVSCRV